MKPKNQKMAEKKRKSKGERVDNKKKKKDDNKRKKSGPRLPSQLQKEIDFLNPNPTNTEDATDSDDSERVIDCNNLYYEYDEPIPQEESKKNRRFDPVDNLEYELPDQFEVCDFYPLPFPSLVILSFCFFVFSRSSVL